MRPPEALSPTVAAVTVAVLAGAHTVRDVAAACAITVGPVHFALVKARRMGLVTWDDGKQRTLRPAVGLAASDYERSAPRP